MPINIKYKAFEDGFTLDEDKIKKKNTQKIN